jgi:hypothetical protein
MKFDLQDMLLLLGVGCVVGGIGAWSKPAAAIVFGCFCLLGVLLIERGARARKAKSGTASE